MFELPSEFRINSADNNIQSAELKRNINGKEDINEPPSKFRLSSADITKYDE